MILDRYIFRELFFAFVFTFVVILFICMVGLTFKASGLSAGAGLAMVGQSVPMALAMLAPWVILIAMCTTLILVYGRLSAEQEIDAMAMAGRTPLRILGPAIFFSLILSFGSYFLHEYAAPWSHLHQRTMVRQSIIHLLKSPPPGNQTFTIGPYMLGYTHYQDGEMKRLILIDGHDQDQRLVYTAEAGRFDLEDPTKPRLFLRNGELTGEGPEKAGGMKGEGEIRIELDVSSLKRRRKGTKDLSSAELLERVRTIPSQSRRNDAMTQYYARRALALGPLFLTLLCAPIGILIRKGSRLAGFGSAVPPFLLYLLCTLVGRAMGEGGHLPPVIAGWLPDIATLLAALPFLWKVFRR